MEVNIRCPAMAMDMAMDMDTDMVTAMDMDIDMDRGRINDSQTGRSSDYKLSIRESILSGFAPKWDL